ncbi:MULTISPECIES: Rv3235 family protein [Streptomycetaceae]|uniref:Uncharacterized protein n=1 Tax=Streptantibioticus cattleyicolor (strain ATCC 35852 / DSM 46488 / JCM 4925 / NBRC 14057 / NRRL 8057) TaxID=1003195 RepID=F8JUF9_STREN|nr:MULTISPECIES: Rv3235 family protein [Streptomycetaceae]AEW94369.1 hypothetical protein SCATT_19980 [Streptantibioticus cattleyicolor NRRL 8057 = DSM 46488]MYS59019.1 hypothetical protein [Streptomyces sp. SID5468]CCB74727.1 conserved protein of unknown function [Streptantibioticus cattleyicolor NRRL 8057 = DSM 46488]
MNTATTTRTVPTRRTGTTAPPSRTDPRRPATARRAGPVPGAPRWFADRLVEVLSGRRPASWLLSHTGGADTYDRLWDLAARGVLRPPAGHPAPVVRRCGCRPARPGALEVFATVASGPAVRALAFRLERGADQRWRCTAVDFAGPSWR